MNVATKVFLGNSSPLQMQGTNEYGYGVTFRSRKADVHKTLISASKIHKPSRSCVIRMEARSFVTAAHLQERFNNSFERDQMMTDTDFYD